jgi:YgiT-type zinc finger domain-containing protein
MRKKTNQDICPLCGGLKKNGKTTFTATLETGVVVIKDVPAKVCGCCGEEWITDEAAREIEELVSDARKRRLQVEVLSMGAVKRKATA